jgi:hypothetical protein
VSAGHSAVSEEAPEIKLAVNDGVYEKLKYLCDYPSGNSRYKITVSDKVKKPLHNNPPKY